jgi:hypothetical protein
MTGPARHPNDTQHPNDDRHPGDDRHPNDDRHPGEAGQAGHPSHAGHAEIPADLAALLREIVPAGGRFGHRQHIHLAYLMVRRHGTQEAVNKISDWIRHIAAYEQAPQKYNATMTRAWTQLVGHHVEAGPPTAEFSDFVARNPALLDKRLLSRHYRSSTLASTAARTGWIDPDLASFPWLS